MQERFKFDVEITRAYRNESGKMVIEGVASSTAIDSYRTIFSEKCQRGWIEDLNNGLPTYIEVNHDGKADWTKRIGKVVEAFTMNNENNPNVINFHVRAELDEDNPNSHIVFKAINAPKTEYGQPAKLGLSINGYVEEVRYEKINNEVIEVYDKARLEMIGVVEYPANPDTFVTAIRRSLDPELVKRNLETRATDFPQQGDDMIVSLNNSQYPIFDQEYAQKLKEEYPDIWDKGGNIEGNNQYNRLLPIVTRQNKKPLTDIEDMAIRKREAWAARHLKDFRVAGVVAQIKWFVIGSRGESYMKELINEEKKKYQKSLREGDLERMEINIEINANGENEMPEDMPMVEPTEMPEVEDSMAKEMDLARMCGKKVKRLMEEFVNSITAIEESKLNVKDMLYSLRSFMDKYSEAVRNTILDHEMQMSYTEQMRAFEDKYNEYLEIERQNTENLKTIVDKNIKREENLMDNESVEKVSEEVAVVEVERSEEVTAEETVEEEVVREVSVKEEISSVVRDFADLVKELKNEIVEIKRENAELNSKLTELSKKPAKSIASQIIEQRSGSNEGNFLKLLSEGRLHPDTAEKVRNLALNGFFGRKPRVE